MLNCLCEIEIALAAWADHPGWMVAQQMQILPKCDALSWGTPPLDCDPSLENRENGLLMLFCLPATEMLPNLLIETLRCRASAGEAHAGEVHEGEGGGYGDVACAYDDGDDDAVVPQLAVPQHP